MNTTTTTTKTSLKETLISEVALLKGMAVPRKTFIKKVAERHPQYSISYISMYLNKCVVNNPSRATWGRAIDLFATKGKYLLTKADLVAQYVKSAE